MNVTIRPQRIMDAKRFFEILQSKKFRFFDAHVRTLKDEVKFLKANAKRQRDNFAHNFTVLLNGKIVGGCGIKIDQHRPYIGEIGYFIDEKHWGQGIATRAVKLLEKTGFQKLGLRRIQILMHPRNAASERVAIKAGYKKEGRMKKAIHPKRRPKVLHDCFLYAKVR